MKRPDDSKPSGIERSYYLVHDITNHVKDFLALFGLFMMMYVIFRQWQSIQYYKQRARARRLRRQKRLGKARGFRTRRVKRLTREVDVDHAVHVGSGWDTAVHVESNWDTVELVRQQTTDTAE